MSLHGAAKSAVGLLGNLVRGHDFPVPGAARLIGQHEQARQGDRQELLLSLEHRRDKGPLDVTSLLRKSSGSVSPQRNMISGSPFYQVAQRWMKGDRYNADFKVDDDKVWLDW